MTSRYDRQTALPELGAAGQERLRRCRVLIVGVGGLGSPIALYLAGAGIGTLGLADDDTVSLTNLPRQVLYTEQEVGEPKVTCAARRLRAMNSDVGIEPHALRLTPENARSLVERYDIVVDGCDNCATRYLLSDMCAELGRPYVYGAIRGFEGQVSVLCHGTAPRTYRDLYPDEDRMCSMKADKAVLGTTPAVVGSVQACETLKLAAGIASPLVGRLWTVDLRTMLSHLLEF